MSLRCIGGDIMIQRLVFVLLLTVIVEGSVYAEDAKVKNGGVRIAQIVDF